MKWDAWNRLVEAKDGATVIGVYEYDALNRRVKRHVDSQAPDNPNGIDTYLHYFYNSAWQVLETRDTTTESDQPENLQPDWQYVWSPRYIDAPVLRDKNTDADGLCDDERLYYLGDANFNVTTLVDTGGDAVERYLYEPYGKETIYDGAWGSTRSASSYGNVVRYTGREWDGETGFTTTGIDICWRWSGDLAAGTRLGIGAECISLNTCLTPPRTGLIRWGFRRAPLSSPSVRLPVPLSFLFAGLPACGGFFNGIWYKDHPADSQEEGTLFGAIWSDGGSCKKTAKWVHVRLFFSTRISNGTCDPKFEDEIVQYHPNFQFRPEEFGCDVFDKGTIHRSPNWQRGDCSYVTWAWDCAVECGENSGDREICTVPPVSVAIWVFGFTYEMHVHHSVEYRDKCCHLSPCNAKAFTQKLAERFSFSCDVSMRDIATQ